MGTLEQLDHSVFLAINGAHTPFLDTFMYTVSQKKTWIPLYVLLFGYSIWKYKWKAVWIVLGAVAVIALCDTVSTQLIKDTVKRLRPCHDPAFAQSIHMVRNKCGGLYGFVSSHAANTAGLALFVIISGLGGLKRREPLSWLVFCIMIVYALLNGYSRIYLGVHYPTDVLAGMLLGILIGAFTGKMTARFALKPAIAG